ncbi:MAG: hypothetical protein HY058_03415 [Proteobacteria bacterium]|nr:hypothetical protein [Pseudomonadota bacterium]
MLEDSDIEVTALRHRRRALNATNRVILRAYSAIVLRLHQRGLAGPVARKSAIQTTADAVSRMTGVTISASDVEEAIARN